MQVILSIFSKAVIPSEPEPLPDKASILFDLIMWYKKSKKATISKAATNNGPMPIIKRGITEPDKPHGTTVQPKNTRNQRIKNAEPAP